MKLEHITHFNDLSPSDLYNLLKLRQDVFIIEQDCIYEDIDRIDFNSEHMLVYDKTTLAAYARIVPAGLKFDAISIGRVVVHPKMRRKGLGKRLMKQALDILKKRKEDEVKIEAQQYLQKFYRSFGFKNISDPFDLDGIPHINMSLKFDQCPG